MNRDFISIILVFFSQNLNTCLSTASLQFTLEIRWLIVAWLDNPAVINTPSAFIFGTCSIIQSLVFSVILSTLDLRLGLQDIIILLLSGFNFSLLRLQYPSISLKYLFMYSLIFVLSLLVITLLLSSTYCQVMCSNILVFSILV